MSDVNLNDSVVTGDVITGIKTEKVNLQNIMNAEFKSDRKTCPYCEASGNHTFFACSTSKCSNRYCEYCPPNADNLCGTCQEFTELVNSWAIHLASVQRKSDSILEEKVSLQKEKDREIENLSSSSTEMSIANLKDRAKFCHLSTNLQLVSFLTLILFSKIILNLAHGIEIISYSFIGMITYNLIRRFYESFPLSQTYIFDIVFTMAILLISVIISNLISGFGAILLVVIAVGMFSFRIFNLGLILQGNFNRISEFNPIIDYSAIGFSFSSILCVLFVYF